MLDIMRCVGLVPAAGRGSRFGLPGFAKELFPLLVNGEIARTRPICDFAFHAVASAGADRAVVVVSPEKAEIGRILGAGEELGLSLGYVVQRSPQGLPHAITLARPWLEDAVVVFAMPDTVVLPQDALRQIREHQQSGGADLVLGVFPVTEPERLGPVDIARDGSIRRVLDKPPHRLISNSWALACWTPRFTSFCCEWERERVLDSREHVLGHVFQAAIEAGLSAQAVYFKRGSFLDMGTPDGLKVTLDTLVQRGLIL